MPGPRLTCSLSKYSPFGYAEESLSCVEEAPAPSPASGKPRRAEGDATFCRLHALDGIGHRFPGLSLWGAQGEQGLRFPLKPRPGVCISPRRGVGGKLRLKRQRGWGRLARRESCPRTPSPVKGAEGSGEARRGSSLLLAHHPVAAAHANSEAPRHLTATSLPSPLRSLGSTPASSLSPPAAIKTGQ